MDALYLLVSKTNNVLWGYVLIFLLVGTGIYLSIKMRGIQFSGIRHGLRLTRGAYEKDKDEGDLSHFQALATALSATIGVGNIAGVAIAISHGGPGALFWMWVTAIVGMATKFTSCALAVKYRKINEDGTVSGGPMHFIEIGLGPKWKWLAVAFAVFAGFATFGAGCMAQAGELARAALALFPQLSHPVMGGEIDLGSMGVGVFVAFMVGIVIVGGIRRIGEVTSKLVPFMAAFYILAAVFIIILNIDKVPAAFYTIFSDAFTGTAAEGGFLGAGFIMALQWGVKRGLFSNESGQGSAPIAHATAKTRYPISEGYVALLGPFIDTIIICTLTALVIIMTGAWTVGEGLDGADLTAYAFRVGLGDFHAVADQAKLGRILVTVGVILFAYSTSIAWSYYGDRCVSYLFGLKAVMPYRIIFCLMLVVGATIKIDLVWEFCDVMNGMMAIPNLVALILLSNVIWKDLVDYKKMIPEFDREAGLRKRS